MSKILQKPIYHFTFSYLKFSAPELESKCVKTEARNKLVDRLQQSIQHKIIKREGESDLTTKGVIIIIHIENKTGRENSTLIISLNTSIIPKKNEQNTPWQCF